MINSAQSLTIGEHIAMLESAWNIKRNNSVTADIHEIWSELAHKREKQDPLDTKVDQLQKLTVANGGAYFNDSGEFVWHDHAMTDLEKRIRDDRRNYEERRKNKHNFAIQTARLDDGSYYAYVGNIELPCFAQRLDSLMYSVINNICVIDDYIAEIINLKCTDIEKMNSAISEFRVD